MKNISRAGPEGPVSCTDRLGACRWQAIFMPSSGGDADGYAEAEKIQADKVQGEGQPL
jgi:hypothetical protein